MDNSFCKLSRKALKAFISNQEHLWRWCVLLEKVNWVDTEVKIGKSVFILRRGQLFGTFIKLSEIWNCSVDSAFRFTKKLISLGLVTKEVYGKYTILTIVGYDWSTDRTETISPGEAIDTSAVLNALMTEKKAALEKFCNDNNITTATFQRFSEMIINEWNLSGKLFRTEVMAIESLLKQLKDKIKENNNATTQSDIKDQSRYYDRRSRKVIIKDSSQCDYTQPIKS